MADATATQSDIKVSQDVANRFPEIVELIKGSKSMNTEERQYWADALPVMTQDQISSLKNILDNEKEQVSKAQSTYDKKVANEVQKSTLAFDEVAYREKKRMIQAAEAEDEIKDEKKEDAILKELENM